MLTDLDRMLPSVTASHQSSSSSSASKMAVEAVNDEHSRRASTGTQWIGLRQLEYPARESGGLN